MFSIPLSGQSAAKSRDNFVERLYSYLFKTLVQNINMATDFSDSHSHISILDIAGFGKCRIEFMQFIDRQICIHFYIFH